MGRNSREGATQTREHLLEVADRLFAERGYAETKIEVIASMAGFTRGAFYRHFPSKEDLFLALLDHRSERQQSEWRQLDSPEGSRSVTRWYEMNLKRQRGFDAAVREFIAYASRRPDLLARLRQREAATLDTLAGFMPDDAGLSRRDLAAMVLAVGEGLADQLTLSNPRKAELFSAAMALITRRS